jgi:hypothetical protein
MRGQVGPDSRIIEPITVNLNQIRELSIPQRERLTYRRTCNSMIPWSCNDMQVIDDAQVLIDFNYQGVES